MLQDTEHLYLHVQLIEESLNTLLGIYKVEGSGQFCEILHLCMLAFDKVIDFYRDQLFDELLVQPVLSLALRFVDLLNKIPEDQNDRYHAPITPTLLEQTGNL